MKKRVLCFGNSLHGDDGLGHFVYEQLIEKKHLINSDCEIIFAGIAGLNALRYFENVEEVLIIDCFEVEGKSGLIVCCDAEDFDPSCPNNSHQVGIDYVLQAVKAVIPVAPKITLMGITGEKITAFKLELSPSVQEKIPSLLKQIENWVTAT